MKNKRGKVRRREYGDKNFRGYLVLDTYVDD
jgi:hypothetical protein